MLSMWRRQVVIAVVMGPRLEADQGAQPRDVQPEPVRSKSFSIRAPDLNSGLREYSAW